MLNTRLGAYGQVTDLSLDTTHRSFRLRCALHGEREPIDLVIRKYRIEQVNRRTWLTVVDAVSSREWLTAALRRFGVGRRFHVAPKAATALRLLA